MNKQITIKSTYEGVEQFNLLAELFLKKAGNKMSGFLFTIKKTQRSIKDILSKIQEEKQELLIEYTPKDKDGYLIIETDKPLKLTPEDQKIYNNKFREIMMKPVEVSVFQYTDLSKIPDGVGIANWDVLAPFALPDLTDDLFERLVKSSNS